MDNGFDLPEEFLSKIQTKDIALEKAIKEGGVVCNTDNPEECISCGS